MRSHKVTGLSPLDVLFDAAQGEDIYLPSALRTAYGRLSFPLGDHGPYVVANFVESLDGVVSLDVPGQSGGGPISGSNQHDRLVMGLLRAVADAVIVGAGTLRSVPQHIWTAEYIYPAFADEFASLRSQLGRPPSPLNVFVSGSGDLDHESAIFRQSQVPVHVVTTGGGATRMNGSLRHVPRTAFADGETFSAPDIIRALDDIGAGRMILLEAGPRTMGQFLAERALDELFLTISPQVAGRDDSSNRPGLVSGRSFAPGDPRWATLVSVRRAANHLFLRYQFPRAGAD